MNIRPFLSNFVTYRKDQPIDYKVKYDKNKDYNNFIVDGKILYNDSTILNLETKTAIKSEQPDFDPSFDSMTYCLNTITEIKSEKPEISY